MFTPTIGQEGIWSIRAPFNALIEPGVIYRCDAIRTLSGTISSGKDPWLEIYQPRGVSVDDFRNDVQYDVNIVTFHAGTGNWVEIPASYIEGAPNTSGERFTPAMLGLYLGHVSETLAFEDLVMELKSVVEKSVGITPEIKLTSMGPSVLLSDEQKARVAIARDALRGEQPENPYTKCRRLEAQNKIQQETIKQLNAYIASKGL